MCRAEFPLQSPIFTKSTTGGGCRRRRDPFRALSILLGAVLLSAAGLKAHQLATEPFLGSDVLDSRWLLVSTTAAEAVVAGWLWSSRNARLCWAVCVVLFSLFAVVALSKVVAGATTCGCFGVIAVAPRVTFVLDSTVLILLAFIRPPYRSRLSFEDLSRCALCRWLIGGWLGATLLLTGAIHTMNPARDTDYGRVVSGGRGVVLEPMKWPGRVLPLLGLIDVGDRLRDGRWIVVLYRHDCPHCQQMIGQDPTVFQDLMTQTGAGGIAFVELPPYTLGGVPQPLRDGPFVTGRLADRWQWYVETPVEVLLDNGQVVSVLNPQRGRSGLATAGGTKAPVWTFGSTAAPVMWCG